MATWVYILGFFLLSLSWFIDARSDGKKGNALNAKGKTCFGAAFFLYAVGCEMDRIAKLIGGVGEIEVMRGIVWFVGAGLFFAGVYYVKMVPRDGTLSVAIVGQSDER